MAGSVYALYFGFSAAGVQSWIADADYIFTGALRAGTQNSVLVTTSKELGVGEATIPTSNNFRGEVLYMLAAAGVVAPPVRVPVAEGTEIMVKVGGICSCVLYFEPAVSIEI